MRTSALIALTLPLAAAEPQAARPRPRAGEHGPPAAIAGAAAHRAPSFLRTRSAVLGSTREVAVLAVCLVVVQPETVIRWHRDWLRRRWARCSGRNRAGRPPLDPDVRTLIVEMATANPLWGAPA